MRTSFFRITAWPVLVVLVSLAFLAVSPGLAMARAIVVQVMSVNNQASAIAEADRLLAQGVPSFQRFEEISGVGLRYRVYLGPFDTTEEATAAAEALKSSGLITEYIVRDDTGAEYMAAPPLATQAQTGQPAQAAPPSQEYWPPSPGVAPAQPAAQPSQEYWPPVPGQTTTSPATQEGWPPLPGQAPAAQAPVAQVPVAQAPVPPTQGQADPPVVPIAPAPVLISQGPGEPMLAPSAQGAITTGQPQAMPQAPPQPVASTPQGDQSLSGVPALPPQGAPAPVVPVAPAGSPLAPSAQVTSPGVIPAKPTGPMKIQGFVILTDLSSSMRRLSPCPGGLVKQEAVNSLLRKINHRIPSQPYIAALRVFGYKQAWSRSDYTTLYFGPATYNRSAMEEGIGRLFAADSISPFGFALSSSESELAAMNNPRAILMFADFEETTDGGAPADKAKAIHRKYGDDTKVYTYYVTRQARAIGLASDIAKSGGGLDYNVCDMLLSDDAFESMMNEIFGPADLPPCRDADGDGVCDESDVCPSTPPGAPVDERGCWIAAYSQFFDFDKAEVKSAFHPRLKYAAELIMNNPGMGTITIAGHTDSKGTDNYNMELGRKRAEAVRDLLVKFGAPADRLAVESYGKTRPIATNDTEEGRAKNRRVEFHVGDVPK